MSPIGTRAILLCAAVLTAVVSLPRVKVDGPSMAPTLTAGDRLVVLPGVVTAGALVVARDPREPTRLLVKRATKVDRDGLVLRGDNPAASRYTEARMTAAAEALLEGLNENAVGQPRLPPLRSGPPAPGGRPTRVPLRPRGDRGLALDLLRREPQPGQRSPRNTPTSPVASACRSAPR